MIIVRSQDKEVLVEASTFRICEGFRGGKIAHYTIDTDVQYNEFSIELGEYSSKEKALKVLGDIQNRILWNKYSELKGKHFLYEINVENLVFQMPQDDEVEA